MPRPSEHTKDFLLEETLAELKRVNQRILRLSRRVHELEQHTGTMRPPPMRGREDSLITDIATLEKEMAQIRGPVERQQRRESWFYRQSRGTALKLLVLAATGTVGALLHWILSKLGGK